MRMGDQASIVMLNEVKHQLVYVLSIPFVCHAQWCILQEMVGKGEPAMPCHAEPFGYAQDKVREASAGVRAESEISRYVWPV